MGKLSIDKEHKQIIKTELKNYREILKPHSMLGMTFTQDEVYNAIKKTKLNKGLRTYTSLTMFY